MQILILGSDTRDGKNAEYGAVEDSKGYGKSDVMMLMDISADNKRVSVISFPRDLLVDIPKCTDQKTEQVLPGPQRRDDQRGHGGGRHRLRRGYGQQTDGPRRSTTS